MRLHPAYLAGVLDSDGHICADKRRRFGTPRIGVTNTSASLMDLLLVEVGGSMLRHDKRQRCCEPGCTRKHLHVRSVCWQWECGGERAAIALRAVLPHLVVKRARAEEVLQMWADGLAEMERPKRRLCHMLKARDAMEAIGWPLDAVRPDRAA